MGKKGKRKSTSGAEKKVIAATKEILGLCQDILEVVSTEFPVHPSAQWEEYEKIHTLVEKIRCKQKGDTIRWEEHSREAHIDQFIAWFRENGGKAENVEIHNFGEEGFGLRATSDIKTSDVFVTVPEKIMMTVESAMKSELGPLVSKDRVLRSMQHAALALHVLCEKLRDDSPWKPYLDLLPSSYTTSLYFSPDDMKTMQGSPTLGDALKPYRSIARQYAYFFKLFLTSSSASQLTFKRSFTFDDFRWAVSTVMTRQNQVPVSNNQSMKALIPMWDMCNHCNGIVTTGFDDKEKACKSLALRSFKTGEQVFIFYGKRCNADLLFHNGFVFAGNEQDWVNIQLGVSRNDRLYAMKAQILAMAGGLDASARKYPVLRSPDPISSELMMFLRIFCMNEEELKIRLFNPEGRPVPPLSDLAKPGFILSWENEKKLWSFLQMRLQLILGQYKTTNQEDEELLSKEELSIHKRNCIKLCMIEKDILSSAMEHAKFMLQKASRSSEVKATTGVEFQMKGNTSQESGKLEEGRKDTGLIQDEISGEEKGTTELVVTENTSQDSGKLDEGRADTRSTQDEIFSEERGTNGVELEVKENTSQDSGKLEEGGENTESIQDEISGEEKVTTDGEFVVKENTSQDSGKLEEGRKDTGLIQDGISKSSVEKVMDGELAMTESTSQDSGKLEEGGEGCENNGEERGMMNRVSIQDER